MHLLEWWPKGTALNFGHPWLLTLLLAVPLLAWLRGRAGKAAALVFSSTAPLRALGKQSTSNTGRILRSLSFAAMALLVLALSRPQLGKTLNQIEASGIDIMLVLDVSGSMLTMDYTIGGQEATRLDAVRDEARKFIEARPNDRIGMIAFGTQPYVVSPMTLDHDWLLQNLERVRIGLVEGNTAIGSAMAAAGSRLNDRNSKSRAIVLLTDGDNNAGRIPPQTAAEALKALHIKFYAIGIGTNGQAPVPVGGPNGSPLTDLEGRIVYRNEFVHFNEEGLKEIAEIAGGQFYRAADTKSLESIFHDIDKLEKSTVTAKKYQENRDLFPACIMSGGGLLLAALLLSQTIWKKMP